jgi:WXXGXW repeat (2 copies)
MNLKHITLLIAACAAAPLASRAGVEIGVNIGGPVVVVHSQPPVERYEVIGVAPGPGYVWIRGHWGWRHERWEWLGGRWERPAQPGTVWIAGQWAPSGNGWVWVEGHFDVQQMPPPPVETVEMVANEAPPAAIYESVPAAPGPDFFWIGGNWQWRGRWVWAHGHYDRHPHFHQGAGWESGHWDHAGGHYVWREGHWR